MSPAAPGTGLYLAEETPRAGSGQTTKRDPTPEELRHFTRKIGVFAP